jgi:hypothetical protein
MAAMALIPDIYCIKIICDSALLRGAFAALWALFASIINQQNKGD